MKCIGEDMHLSTFLLFVLPYLIAYMPICHSSLKVAVLSFSYRHAHWWTDFAGGWFRQIHMVGRFFPMICIEFLWSEEAEM